MITTLCFLIFCFSMPSLIRTTIFDSIDKIGISCIYGLKPKAMALPYLVFPRPIEYGRQKTFMVIDEILWSLMIYDLLKFLLASEILKICDKLTGLQMGIEHDFLFCPVLIVIQNDLVLSSGMHV